MKHKLINSQKLSSVVFPNFEPKKTSCRFWNTNFSSILIIIIYFHIYFTYIDILHDIRSVYLMSALYCQPWYRNLSSFNRIRSHVRCIWMQNIHSFKITRRMAVILGYPTVKILLPYFRKGCQHLGHSDTWTFILSGWWIKRRRGGWFVSSLFGGRQASEGHGGESLRSQQSLSL
jgi:hypothetical protein